MFELIFESLKYLRGLPVELTEAAVLAGEVKSGAVVGLLGSLVGDEGKKVLIEVVLSEDEQADLLKPGVVIPLDGEGGVYRISPEWRRYLPRR